MIAEVVYAVETAPPPGTVAELAPGLFWACMPLPFQLNHVNLWLLQDNDGWSVVDAGCDTPAIRMAWEDLLAGPMGGQPLNRLIATHGHVDHIGLAGWLCRRFGATYVGTFAEWIWARLGHMHDVPEAERAHLHFLLRHGLTEDDAEVMSSGRGRFMDLATDLPGSIHEIRDGQEIRFGGRDWQVIVTRGHAYEHASFYCSTDNILIAGDHLLPRISPVIAVFEMVPEADPLADYLASFDQFLDIADDVLVLPSHGLPYRGLHRRIGELRAHHASRLDATMKLVVQPRTAIDIAGALFPHVKGSENAAFALSETLAHLNLLVNNGQVIERQDGGGRSTFVAACNGIPTIGPICTVRPPLMP